MTDSPIPCDFRVFAIDETDNWPDDVTAITGKIAGVYVANFADVIHIASFRGSIWAEFVCNITKHYIREPDGYRGKEPYWEDIEPDDWLVTSGTIERSKALVKAWNGPFHGLTYEGANESSHYLDEGFSPAKSSPIDMASCGWDDWSDCTTDDDREAFRDQRQKAAMEAVQEYMSNGEEWDDLAPWNVTA